MMRAKPIVLFGALLIMAGCNNRYVEFETRAEHCPLVRISVVGGLEWYEVLLEVGEEGSVQKMLLVPQIDMPQDVTQYIKYVKNRANGVEIGIVESEFVRDVRIEAAQNCVIYTSRIADGIHVGNDDVAGNGE